VITPCASARRIACQGELYAERLASLAKGSFVLRYSAAEIRTGISLLFSFIFSGALRPKTQLTLMPTYVATIGLEVHVQLKTRTKMFCCCAVEHGAEPNTNICPVCLGYPGALPVINEEALRLTALTGLMLGCQIPEVCKFDRKNYFYPDMPKNYQISQYDRPFCIGGTVPLHLLAYPKDAQKSIATKDKKVRLVRIHLEEDVAKSFHMENATGIDFNRAGTPLLEIVSEPDIANPEEAFAYLAVLQQVVVYGGISDADMEKGQLRCDVNVSVRPLESKKWGTKIEIKNLNSISGVRRALEFEIRRQTGVLEAGRALEQETRRWDDLRGETQLMRVKESAHDYRYFPDPDLLPVKTASFVGAAQLRKPELPWEKRARYVADFAVTEYDAAVLASDLSTARFFEMAAAGARKPKSVANWILNDLQSALAAANKTIAECPITPAAFDELVNLIEDGKINSKQGKEVFAEMFASGRAASEIVRERGLEQLSDTAAIETLADEVIRANPGPAADFKAGKLTALNFLKGQVMKLSKGKANPQLAGEILQKKIGR
jgi:aspartyl-tRNA(Asn)/glutamyl-tRNA(Gln) amidotransferase subunit B